MRATRIVNIIVIRLILGVEYKSLHLLRSHYGTGVDSASNRNEYQDCFLGVKAAGVYGWQPYHLHVPIVLKSGGLNLLETSGPVQSCNGIDFIVCL
jgi:hypothetical protein